LGSVRVHRKARGKMGKLTVVYWKITSFLLRFP